MKYLKMFFASLTLMIFGIASANAALAAAVTTAISDAQTDGVTLAGLALALFIAIVVFRYIRKAV